MTKLPSQPAILSTHLLQKFIVNVNCRMDRSYRKPYVCLSFNFLKQCSANGTCLTSVGMSPPSDFYERVKFFLTHIVIHVTLLYSEEIRNTQCYFDFSISQAHLSFAPSYDYHSPLTSPLTPPLPIEPTPQIGNYYQYKPIAFFALVVAVAVTVVFAQAPCCCDLVKQRKKLLNFQTNYPTNLSPLPFKACSERIIDFYFLAFTTFLDENVWPPF